MKEYIITKVKEKVLGIPCVKQPVYAMIKTIDNYEFFGTNSINNEDVTICPREELEFKSGEGYHLCQNICKQNAHAEVMAIQNALEHKKELFFTLEGAKLFLVGHTYCCDNCLSIMHEHGIFDVEILK